MAAFRRKGGKGRGPRSAGVRWCASSCRGKETRCGGVPSVERRMRFLPSSAWTEPVPGTRTEGSVQGTEKGVPPCEYGWLMFTEIRRTAYRKGVSGVVSGAVYGVFPRARTRRENYRELLLEYSDTLIFRPCNQLMHNNLQRRLNDLSTPKITKIGTFLPQKLRDFGTFLPQKLQKRDLSTPKITKLSGV